MSDLDTHAQAGISAINDKRYDDAVTSFEQALALAPDRPDMNSALGMAHLHRGSVGDGVPFLEAAVRLGDGYADAEHADMKVHFATSLATAYQIMDRVGDAREVLTGLVGRFPQATEARLQLGQLLLESCGAEEGARLYAGLAEDAGLDDEQREAARAVAGCVRAFLASDDGADVFLQAHQESYRSYFDEIAASQPEWFPEAARLARGADGEPQPYLPEGARPYALLRVDLVNPETNEVASVYSDQEPMVVAVEGMEPLAQIAVLLPWDDQDLETWVCTRCPWHWLPIVVELEDPDSGATALDEAIGSWYLSGYNGDFGSADAGRFHYIGDPERVQGSGIAYVVDLGRAGFEAIPSLMNRLRVLNETHPIRRVLLGGGRLP